MGKNKELLLYITTVFSDFPAVEGLSSTAVSF
jgi:hypothetical protein